MGYCQVLARPPHLYWSDGYWRAVHNHPHPHNMLTSGSLSVNVWRWQRNAGKTVAGLGQEWHGWLKEKKMEGAGKGKGVLKGVAEGGWGKLCFVKRRQTCLASQRRPVHQYSEGLAVSWALCRLGPL